jgi:hypothetical protein
MTKPNFNFFITFISFFWSLKNIYQQRSPAAFFAIPVRGQKPSGGAESRPTLPAKKRHKR